MRTFLQKRGPVIGLFFFLLGCLTVPALGQAANTYAVTNTNFLVRFNTATPGTLTTIGPIANLQVGESIVGIDFRPATGELFALGSTSRLYTLNKNTAAASLVGVLSTSLAGTSFGMDFNPTVDRIRVVSNTGQNLRINPISAAVTVDTPLNGAATTAEAVAYTNGFNGATVTTLYDISAASDMLLIQNPPNNGMLTNVGPLGVNVSEVNGFDMWAANNTAYAALTVGATTGLYTINLGTGAATLIGNIGAGATTYSGFAIEIASVTNYVVYGVTFTNNLIRFNSSRPNTILSSVPITGISGSVLGIDFRPATGQLYAITSTNRLYRIDPATGVATSIGAEGSFVLSGANFGFDINPVPDRIRVTSDLDQNLRLNPNDGTLTATDGTLAFAAGDPNAGQNPTVVGSAYTNSFAGATATTLYDIDSNLDILATQNPPNSGTLNTVGSLGVNAIGDAGFDITPTNNLALAAFQLIGSPGSTLYSVNLTTGAAAPVGPIGAVPLRDIAIARSTAANAATATLDFDGDGRTDYTLFNTSLSTWFVNRSSDNSYFAVQFGNLGSDILTPGDYDGDGKTDIAVWRSTNGTFYILRSSDGAASIVQWGITGDRPVPRDYDGDGKTDFAVARPAGAQLIWYVLHSTPSSPRIEHFGLSTDVAAPGDYDGDGRYDLAVYRRQSGQPSNYYVQASTTGFHVFQWGLDSDQAVPGDYDGDGKTDIAVVRPGASKTWFIRRSSDGSLYADVFGGSSHSTTQGDYDGDGRTDLSTWEPMNATFYFLRTTVPGSTSQYTFGQSSDTPVANIYTH